MKHLLFSIMTVAALAIPTAAMASHEHERHGHHESERYEHRHHDEHKHYGGALSSAHQCDSKATCPLGYKDCSNHKNCPTGKHDCTAGMDSNKDGKVSLKEFTEAHSERMKKRFERLDANGDGFITDADRKNRETKYLDRFFANADSDKDGKLSKEEFSAAKGNYRHGKKECPLSKKK